MKNRKSSPLFYWSKVSLAFLCSLIFSNNSNAYFEICNDSDEKVYSSYAFKSGEVYVSEGWWTLEPGGCAVVDGGRLRTRYVYAFAKGHDGGKWDGNYYFCTNSGAFTISGDSNCRSRGFNQTGFFEVDTGDADDFTLSLTESSTRAGGDVFEIDIAPILNADPKIAQDIKNLCNNTCAGNESKSWLHSAILRLNPNSTFSTGTISLRLRSKHKPFSGVTLYSNTEKVKLKFKVHNVSCRAEITSVSASGFVAQVSLSIVDQISRIFNQGGLNNLLGEHKICA